MPDTSEETRIAGIFNKDEIPTAMLFKVENLKTNFLIQLNDLDVSTAASQLTSLLSAMLDVIGRKPFVTSRNDDIKEYKVHVGTVGDLNFYQLKEFGYDNYDNDMDSIRLVAEKASAIYNHFTGILGVELPTGVQDFLRKMTDNFFSLVPNTESVFDELSGMYHANNYRETNKALNWYALNLSQLPRYDLDAPTIILGEARSGKSTLTLWLIKRYFEYKYPQESVYDIQHRLLDIVQKHTFFSVDQHTNPFDAYETPVWFDESYAVLDRRNSMNQSQIDLTGKLNAYASHKNPVFALIQQLSDLDERVVNKSNVILVYERGDAYTFMRHKNFPILKTSIFERIKKYPYLIRNKMIGKYSLMRLPNYSGCMNWIPLASPDNKADKWIPCNLDGSQFVEDESNALVYHAYLKEKARWESRA